ncbi:MAG: PKD domain-containing protein [Ferruginibacter sp.]
MRKYLLLITAILFAASSFSQDFSNKGKDFWVGYGYHQIMSNGNGQQMVLYFATDQVTNITITVPGTGYTQTLVSGPLPTVLTSAPIPKTGAQDARLRVESIAAENKGIHIVSDKPIVAYAHIYNQNVSGATILFPTNTLGKEYYSINYENNSNTDEANAWFYVVACDTGITTVEITPSAPTINHPANVTFTVTLTQGQIYNVMGQLINSPMNCIPVCSGYDLTGSKIKSIASASGACKRIGVFSGSGRIGINCTGTSSSSDNYMVQAFPKTAWGKKYLTSHTGGSLTNNIYRICVADPATLVTVNGVPVAVPLINNFYYEIPSTNAQLRIEANLPIIVAQYITSQGQCGNGNPGDPEVIYLSPVEQNIAKLSWNATGNFNITQHYINVVIPNTGTAISSFRLDGIALSPSLFIVHPQEPAYSYLIYAVSQGVRTIESDSGFNAIAYGFGNAESYGYNAGTNIRDLYNFLTPINPYSISIDPVACTGTPFYYSVTFPFQPTSLLWDFHGFPLSSPIPNVAIANPLLILDATYFIGTRQVWRYKLPTTSMYTPAGTYPVTITAGTTTSEGCGNSFERDFDLNVYDPPVADFYWINNGCVTDSVRFRDTTFYVPGTFSYKWYWNFGDGFTDTVRYPKHKYALPGTYTVKFAMISNVGCFSDTSTQQVTVTLVPSADFVTSTPVCDGLPVTFTNASSASAPGTLVKWYWNYGDGVLDTLLTGANHSHTYNPWGNNTITLKVETNSGCQSPVRTKVLYVNPIPVANFTLPGGICLPADSAHFINTSSIADGTQAGFGYLWNFGDPPSGAVNNASTIKDPAHYYTSAGPFNIKLMVTSAAGCTKDTTKTLSTVYPRPLAGFTILPEYCLNAVSTASSTSVGSGSPVTNWYWDFGEGPVQALANGNPVNHTYLTSGTKTIKHWIKTDKGCLSDTSIHTVVINPLPTPDFTTNTPICAIRDITFTDISVANAGNIVLWNWNLGDATLLSLNNNNPFIHQYPNAIPYNVLLTVTTNKGCVKSMTKIVTVNSRPRAGYIVPEVCLNDTYAQFLDSSSIASGSISTYQWNFGDINSTPPNPNTSILQDPPHSYTAIGTYNVQLIVTSLVGCKDTIAHELVINGSFPVANFTVINPGSLCANDSVRIVNTSTVFPGVITKTEVYWDNVGQPGVFETENNPVSGGTYSHLYPNFQSPLTKNFTIRFRAYSGGVCVNDKLQTITVNAAPKVQFNAIPNSCLNIPAFQITQASETGAVPGSFVFSGPGVTTTGLFDPVSVGAGLYTIHYTYTSTSGCRDSAIQQIRVLQAPLAKFGFASPACENKTVLFTDSSTSGVGSLTTWTWDFADGSVPEIRNSPAPFTHIFNAAGTYQVKLVVRTSDGCNSIVKQRAVLISPTPGPNFTFADTSCLPNAFITFNNISTIADGTENAFTYLWNFGDPLSGVLNTSVAKNPTHVFSAVGPYNVKLQVTSSAFCVYDTTIVLNSIHPQPQANFDFSKPSVCIGDQVTFNDLSDGKDGVVSGWNWDFGDSQVSGIQNPPHTYANVDEYDVILFVVNSFGCNSDTITKKYSVYPFPVVNAGADRFVLEGGVTIIQPTVTGNDLQYLWSPSLYLNNYTIKAPTCTPLQDITYTLKVTARGGCVATDDLFVKVLLAPKIPNTITPNNDGFHDHWDILYLDTYPNCKVQVFTRTGQLVFESRGYATPWNGTMNGKPLPVDTYYYIIEPESGRKPLTGYVAIIK